VYLQARKARKAAQVKKQIDKHQREKAREFTFAPVLDARSVQLVQQARLKTNQGQGRSRSGSNAGVLETAAAADFALLQGVSRRGSSTTTYAAPDAPVHVKQHAQVFVQADRRRAAELDVLREQLALHPFAPVLGAPGAAKALYHDADPTHRTVQASKIQAEALAARARAIMRGQCQVLSQAQPDSETTEQQEDDSAVMRNMDATAIVQRRGSSSHVSESAGGGYPDYSPAPSLMSVGVLDALSGLPLAQHAQAHANMRYTPQPLQVLSEGEQESPAYEREREHSGGYSGRAGLVRLGRSESSSGSMLQRWVDGPDTDETETAHQGSAGAPRQNDAIYGSLQSVEHAGGGAVAGAGFSVGQHAVHVTILPPLPQSAGSGSTGARSHAFTQEPTARSAAMFSPSRFIAARVEDYGYTPAKEDAAVMEGHGGAGHVDKREGWEAEGEESPQNDHAGHESDCENQDVGFMASPVRKGGIATTLFLSPASNVLGSTHVQGLGTGMGLGAISTTSLGGSMCLGATGLGGIMTLSTMAHDKEEEVQAPVRAHAHAVSNASSGSVSMSHEEGVTSLIHELGLDALEDRIRRLMQTINAPLE
jgi:hypothetical protein